MAQEFKFFDMGTANPIGKYTQPKPNVNKPGNQVDTGYPQTGIKTEGVTMRGGGAATKGIKSRGPMA
jgi:hypothetical protein